ncbi:ribose-5-phosphate isomerase [Candidatus Roizmanbacteria bacterium CG02_land_8_20_14_3_00_36_15]|uniref:Ribose-5-phosphate isomerase n=2 Tax=Candidatus Roizmaniibacteriota TaxID=1752723 RepID=A0A2M8KKG7_9BACT|nr:MAG: ribose-5-phosphate isomerase [Candidatus Roizmanbacteria bacterium CG03_land_8_20_14_0_80_36_21]PIV38082.1 MAG: ribose-5-phosphate isomerase [Candidatus Roizmanbacteria bacterium CG02_land_8_20_14_3_00_36_15]PIY70075.1 MAG: ribose-5-phosphate isomerase [Candidatus Roizmanbacteria bacterium CG_4_10_14_0_8_um_filter_36_36]PJA52676.1 MAG: ribose-5-phosphate isomerase [Candidatus Roizmanbacteria bacterium CG_4_9_14_3_um_filter_36_11]PJC82028.1 MAG: ribose-5-phosphate isomerase [Candidatus R
MTIFIAADHRGFELKNALIEYLHEKNIRIEDLGNYQYEAEDDYPDYAKKVAQAVLQNPTEFLGIVISGSGVGVAITVNRSKGIRCGLGFEAGQLKHTRENDHINVLALAADYLDPETAKKLVDVFIEAKPRQEQKYLRRIKKLDEL